MSYKDFSDYVPTGNKAIDMVSAAVGHSRKFYRTIKQIVLNRGMYGLFKAGAEVLAQRPFDNDAELVFDGVKIVQGASGMFDSMRVEYVNNYSNIMPQS